MNFDKDYYAILGIEHHASQAEIKNEYNNLIKAFHPDFYAGDKEYANKKSSEINEAYRILKDPEKSELYDKYLGLSVEKGKTNTNSYSKEPIIKIYDGNPFEEENLEATRCLHECYKSVVSLVLLSILILLGIFLWKWSTDIVVIALFMGSYSIVGVVNTVCDMGDFSGIWLSIAVLICNCVAYYIFPSYIQYTITGLFLVYIIYYLTLRPIIKYIKYCRLK